MPNESSAPNVTNQSFLLLLAQKKRLLTYPCYQHLQTALRQERQTPINSQVGVAACTHLSPPPLGGSLQTVSKKAPLSTDTRAEKQPAFLVHTLLRAAQTKSAQELFGALTAGAKTNPKTLPSNAKLPKKSVRRRARLQRHIKFISSSFKQADWLQQLTLLPLQNQAHACDATRRRFTKLSVVLAQSIERSKLQQHVATHKQRAINQPRFLAPSRASETLVSLPLLPTLASGAKAGAANTYKLPSRRSSLHTLEPAASRGQSPNCVKKGSPRHRHTGRKTARISCSYALLRAAQTKSAQELFGALTAGAKTTTKTLPSNAKLRKKTLRRRTRLRSSPFK